MIQIWMKIMLKSNFQTYILCYKKLRKVTKKGATCLWYLQTMKGLYGTLPRANKTSCILLAMTKTKSSKNQEKHQIY